MCNWFKFHKEYQRLMQETIAACKIQDWDTINRVREELEQLKIDCNYNDNSEE